MISTNQLRAARVLLRWTAQDLADASGVGVATIRRIEVMEGFPLRRHARTLVAIRVALEAAGIEFIESSNGGIGVMLHEKKLL